MIKAVIFDFDGTIADSFDLFIETLHKLLRRSEPLSKELVSELRGKQIKGIMLSLGVKSWQIPGLVIRGREEIGRNFEGVLAFKEIPVLIRELSSRGYELYVLSSNSEVTIREFLARFDLDRYFKQVYGDIGLSGKTRYLKRLMKEHELNSDSAVYIGDEVRDIEAARRAKLICVSVAWGYSTSESLKRHNPDFIASSAPEVLSVLQNISP